MHDQTKKQKKVVSPREIAYLALLSAKKEESFIANTLELWIQQTRPEPRDAALAREIAYGACRMGLALDHLATQCSAGGKLSIKQKERVLLHTALYQHVYLERIPLYAIANESMALAKKYCHPSFAKFLNAILRKLETFTPKPPEGTTISELSIRYSYPLFFVTALMDSYGLEKTVEILTEGNNAAPTMFRARSSHSLENINPRTYAVVEDSNKEMAVILDSSSMDVIVSSPDFYIQNATPVALMHFLKDGPLHPKVILDLCASPGGKLLMAHDLFPFAALHANDVSSNKIERLKQNIEKYEMDAKVTCSNGEELGSDDKFDLVIIDAPCSNSGVLNKRPEARWRLTAKHIAEGKTKQKELLTNAERLLSKNGEIWYLTCSILPEENERLIEEITAATGLVVRAMKTILPNSKGWDGGFACALKR